MLDIDALYGEARATARWWSNRLLEIWSETDGIISQSEESYIAGSSNIDARRREYRYALALHQSLNEPNVLEFERLLATYIHEAIADGGYRVISPRGRFALDPVFASFLQQAGIATETGWGKILHPDMYTVTRQGFVFTRGVNESQTGCMFFVETT